MFLLGFTPLWASVVFRVGILSAAGGLGNIQATGGDAPCVAVSPTRLQCDSTTPVTFFWTGDPAFELVGEKTIYPGYEGHAWVLSSTMATQTHHEALRAQGLTAQTVRSLYVRDGAHTPPAPSYWMVKHLYLLAANPDPNIRLAAAQAAHPWFSGTKLDPLPVQSPPLLSERLLMTFARDRSPPVRRAVLHMLRDLRPPYSRSAAQTLLMQLARDPKPNIRRAAVASLKRSHQLNIVSPEESWEHALAMVPETGPPGRSACNTLAHLARWVQPSDVIDPEAAITLALKHHPERVWRLWSAWKKRVPLRLKPAHQLLTETVGLSEPLLKRWAQQEPDLLVELLTRWEPSYPHSPRWDQIGIWFDRIEHRPLRLLLGLSPTAPKTQPRRVKLKINLKDVSPPQPAGR